MKRSTTATVLENHPVTEVCASDVAREGPSFTEIGRDGRFRYGPLRLLVMQSTSLCNIDCSYCYLPDRQIARRMRPETVDAVYEDLMTASFVDGRFTTVWHAGEPLTASIPFYEHAIRSASGLLSRGCRVSHSIQTNATLLNDEWCVFLKESGFRVGVSLDGPAFLHDFNRKNRAGDGTHERAMRGVSLLQRHGIAFHAICVVTRRSLDFPDALFAFFASLGLKRLCLNIDEVEGVNAASSMAGPDCADALRRFLDRLYELAATTRMVIREFAAVRRSIYSDRRPRSNMQAAPGVILSVDTEGNCSTFSPELLSMRHPRYGRFVFGNIHRQPFTAMLGSERFRIAYRDITSGIRRCRAACEYFRLCGGGAPSNKVFENGTFDSTETLYCRLTKKVVIDVVVRRMEEELSIPPPDGEGSGTLQGETIRV